MTSIIERTDMKEYTCKYCHKTFSFEDGKKASGFMSAHQRFCEANPKRQWYLEKIRESAKIGNNKIVAILTKKYQQSLKEYSFVCEKCNKEYTKVFSPKKYELYLKKHHFCSRSCANSRSFSEESNKKRSLTLKKKFAELIKNKKIIKRNYRKPCQLRQTKCIDCKVDIFVKTSNNVYCYNCIKNHSDYHLYQLYDKNGHKIISDETKKKLSEKAVERVMNGNHTGWVSRNIESYPEKFWKEVLENNNIKYEFNFPVSKKTLGLNDSSHYFLDFKIGENIDLEIDGKQHKYADRHLKDLERDEVLIKNGWKVYRIEWNEINSSKGSSLMKDKINAFLKWYNLNMGR